MVKIITHTHLRIGKYNRTSLQPARDGRHAADGKGGPAYRVWRGEVPGSGRSQRSRHYFHKGFLSGLSVICILQGLELFGLPTVSPAP